jgi:RNA polymerase sigma-70 factor (ECF subfamily)
MAIVGDGERVPAEPAGEGLFGEARELALLRRRLLRFFSSKGALSAADELADEVLLRVVEQARRGTRIDDMASYALGIARRVWLEHLRNPARAFEPLADGVEPAARATAEPDAPRGLACLERCLVTLRADDRALILRFYGNGDHPIKNKDRRREMADELKISSNALFLRASRIRRDLRVCVEDCCRRTEEER